MNVLFEKIKEVLSTVSPIIILVIVLHFTLAPLSGILLFRFIIGALIIILGLSILLLGIDLAILPFGSHMGNFFLKSNKLWYIIIVGFILGFFINAAEPNLHILAAQVASVTGNFIPLITILVVVAVGTGIMLSLGIIRIVYNIPLHKMLFVLYSIIFFLAIFSSSDMLAIGFDASGATTGALTVPFVLAVAIGVAGMKKDSKSSEENSFGLVAIMASGAILGVLFLNLFVKTDNISGILEAHSFTTNSLLGPFIAKAPTIALESFIALSPMVLMLFIFQSLKFHLQFKYFRKMLKGFLYTYIGLVLFLIGVNAGFMDVGNIIGQSLALYENKTIVVGLGFFLGMLIILTEPAVYVLIRQIESVTSGYINKKIVLAALAIGVALAVGLSILRIVVPEIMLWHYLLPGYIISFLLILFIPKLFIGISFDSGCVASGPMTTTFILAFAQGAADSIEHANVLIDSFGAIAMATMMPIITLQILGLIYKIKSTKE